MEQAEVDSSDAETDPLARVQIKLPRLLVATLDWAAVGHRQSRNDFIRQLITWSLESADSETAKLPEQHPITGRTLKEIYDAPRIKPHLRSGLTATQLKTK